jgi:hypothetical protein
LLSLSDTLLLPSKATQIQQQAELLSLSLTHYYSHQKEDWRATPHYMLGSDRLGTALVLTATTRCKKGLDGGVEGT